MSNPFTTAEARKRGLGRGTLRGPSVRRPFRGVYLGAGTEVDFATRVAAARRVLPPDARADGTTALRLRGVEVGDESLLHFTTTHPHQVRRPGLAVRRVEPVAAAGEKKPSPPDPVAEPAAAFVSAARELDLVDLVAAGDWLVRLGLATPDSLVRAAAAASGRSVIRARRAAGLVRERVDSVRESHLRLCLVLAGLPEPEVNPTITIDDREVGRVDLLLRRWGVVVEYDGDQHRTDRRQWNADLSRNEWLGAAAYVVIRITAERMRHPRTVVTVVHRALVAAGYDGPAAVFDDEWRLLFATAR